MTWAQVPTPVPSVGRPVLAPLTLAAVPSVVAAWRAGADRPSLLAMTAIAALVVLVGRRGPGRAVVASVVGVIVAWGLAASSPPAGGVGPVMTLAAPAAGAWLLALGGVAREPDPRDRALARSTASAPLVVANVVLLVVPSGWPWAMVAVAIGVLVLVVAPLHPRLPAQLAARWAGSAAVRTAGTVASRFVTGVGRGVTVATMVPVAVLVNLLAVLYRLVGHDPLVSPAPRPSTWVRRQGNDPHVDRFYGAVVVEDHRSVRERWARPFGVALVLIIVGLAVTTLRDGGEDPGGSASPPAEAVRQAGRGFDPATCGSDVPTPLAVVDQPDWSRTWCETEVVGHRAESYAPSGYVLSDFVGRTVNISDARRRTWTAPPCGCRRMRVWWFGGSAAWGWFQRDEWSLPSALSRAAWADGVALDIVNHAQPGWTFGQEVRHLAQLTTTDEPPDAVIFYDGGNDLMLQARRALGGRVSDESEVMYGEEALDDLFRNGPFDGRPVGVRWTGIEPPSDTPPWAEGLASEMATHALARYARNQDLASRIAASVGSDVVFAWQPLYDGADDGRGDPSTMSPVTRSFLGALFAAGRRGLPEGVLDLSHSLDDVDRPVFTDQFHTSEYGAAIVAEDLWRGVRDLLSAGG